ncbi:hypothetical protein ACGFWE_40635 [Streptomyces sp. NPDC048523]|uniref:hypothetical protein n=1 Tax=Streptomyces sp. NPDC048523 TaxID=3365567 RepID=UPI003720DA0A
MNSTQREVDHALAYPEPPASPLWHRHGAKARPLTDAQKRRNRELLLLAQRTTRPHSPRPTKPPAEAS